MEEIEIIDQPTKRGKIEPYLSYIERGELARFVAGKGQNYDAYVKYATERGWKVFTKSYYNNWCWRHRPLVLRFRAELMDELRQQTYYDKESRIKSMEMDVDAINARLRNEHSSHICTECGFVHSPTSSDSLVKLIDTKRKLMESIAKEKDEFNKKSEPRDVTPDVDIAQMALLGAGNGET